MVKLSLHLFTKKLLFNYEYVFQQKILFQSLLKIKYNINIILN